jgi:hypothetical protein
VYRQRLVPCAACGVRDYTKCSEKVTLQQLPAIYLMTAEQRLKIAELPVVTLYDVNGGHRQQALAPVFSCFPVFRNILENETAECYKESLRSDTSERYHLHADLVCLPEV